MKQSKLRRRRVFRYAVLYFVMLVVFVGMIVGPIVVGKSISIKPIADSVKDFNLFQPTGLNNDDTQGTTMTGTGSENYSGAYKSTKAPDGKAATTKTSEDAKTTTEPDANADP